MSYDYADSAVDAAVIAELRARVNELESGIRAACDLLAERRHGNPARSPGHNARLKLETALAAFPAREET